jgi:hypothetical protein
MGLAPCVSAIVLDVDDGLGQDSVVNQLMAIKWRLFLFPSQPQTYLSRLKHIQKYRLGSDNPAIHG